MFLEKSIAQQLSGKRIAILATDGFEQPELIEPQRALNDAGATVHVVSPKSGCVRGWKEADWGDEVPVDIELSRARPEACDGLVLPGGQINPDKLRREPAASSSGASESRASSEDDCHPELRGDAA